LQRTTSILFLAALALNGCASPTSPRAHTYSMGDRIELGRLVYTVFETRWLPQIGDGPAARVPQDRFFLIRLSVGKTGAGELLAPNMTIEDDRGNAYQELTDGEGVAQFLGVLHPVTSEATVGNALFDAPPGHYRLRLSDDEGQRTALVDIPLSFGAEATEIPAGNADRK
jgi:hypothetical protein